MPAWPDRRKRIDGPRSITVSGLPPERVPVCGWGVDGPVSTCLDCGAERSKSPIDNYQESSLHCRRCGQACACPGTSPCRQGTRRNPPIWRTREFPYPHTSGWKRRRSAAAFPSRIYIRVSRTRSIWCAPIAHACDWWLYPGTRTVHETDSRKTGRDQTAESRTGPPLRARTNTNSAIARLCLVWRGRAGRAIRRRDDRRLVRSGRRRWSQRGRTRTKTSTRPQESRLGRTCGDRIRTRTPTMRRVGDAESRIASQQTVVRTFDRPGRAGFHGAYESHFITRDCGRDVDRTVTDVHGAHPAPVTSQAEAGGGDCHVRQPKGTRGAYPLPEGAQVDRREHDAGLWRAPLYLLLADRMRQVCQEAGVETTHGGSASGPGRVATGVSAATRSVPARTGGVIQVDSWASNPDDGRAKVTS
jgi:hypothetical protein